MPVPPLIPFRTVMDSFRPQFHKPNGRIHLSYSEIRDPATGQKLLGCEHYPRNCKLRAECCGQWVSCRFCHDRMNPDHTMDRFATKQIICLLCGTVQPISNKCIESTCQTQFASYYCAECKFFDNTPGKDIYHCSRCKLCRKGKGIGQDVYHCDRCNACLIISKTKQHFCAPNAMHKNCPLCGVYLFNSTKPILYMRCGHAIHAACFKEYHSRHNLCSICNKPIIDMKPYVQQMDDNLRREKVLSEPNQQRMSEVECQDCSRRSVTPYHDVYHRCTIPKCGSYNTRVLRTYEKQ